VSNRKTYSIHHSKQSQSTGHHLRRQSLLGRVSSTLFFLSALLLAAKEFVVYVTGVCLDISLLSYFFFKSLLLQFFSDSHETWQYAIHAKMEQIFEILLLKFWNFTFGLSLCSSSSSRAIYADRPHWSSAV